ncbi:hypothetical protein FOA52_013402 [Chlamydomonas sp. UWO 241]|nr:hypothetical protein FOA52_013402 [Chlamydomonas sp. UWO 241]
MRRATARCCSRVWGACSSAHACVPCSSSVSSSSGASSSSSSRSSSGNSHGASLPTHAWTGGGCSSLGGAHQQTRTAGMRHMSYGQPVPETHPELLRPGQLSVGISAEEVASRRTALASRMAPGSLALLPSASTVYMAGIVPYPYRPDPDFAYLSGIMQQGMLALENGTSPDGSSCRWLLFIDPPNPDQDRWDGTRLDKRAALQVFGVDEVHYTAEIPRIIGALAASVLARKGTVYFDVDRTNGFMQQTLGQTLVRARDAASAASAARAQPPASRFAAPPLREEHRILPLRPLLHELRLVKSAAEADLMRTASQAAAAGLIDCIRGSAPGVGEWQLAAAFEYTCRASFGAQRMAYPSVVAGGPDAFYTHYGRNDKPLKAGQMVLMDAGCERHGYVSDVTRTWPVSGRFSGPQADVYDIVLAAHAQCVAAARPGSSIRQLHALSTRIISQGIKDLGLCGPGVSSEEIHMTRYRDFYWHSVGHWLGMDTHDTHLIGHSRDLVPGHVITVEPGLYIPDDKEKYGHYAGIGVRIEDDVLILERGCEVLSAGAPTGRAELEGLVGSAQLAPLRTV